MNGIVQLTLLSLTIRLMANVSQSTFKWCMNWWQILKILLLNKTVAYSDNVYIGNNKLPIAYHFSNRQPHNMRTHVAYVFVQQPQYMAFFLKSKFKRPLTIQQLSAAHSHTQQHYCAYGTLFGLDHRITTCRFLFCSLFISKTHIERLLPLQRYNHKDLSKNADEGKKHR